MMRLGLALTVLALGALGFAVGLTPLRWTLEGLFPRATSGRIPVEFWDYPRGRVVGPWMDAAIAEFERRHPQVDVVFTRLSWSKGGQRLDIAAFSGRPPDVAGGVLQLRYAEQGLLEPLETHLPPEELGDFYPLARAACTWDGHLWALPWYKEAFVVMLNLDLLEERGVAPPTGGRWTWEEFVDAMRRLTFDRDGDGDIDVHGISLATGREKWECYPFLFGEGMEIMSADGRRILIDSEATVRGILRLMELDRDARVVMPLFGGYTDEVSWPAFSGPERRVAATSQGLWSVVALDWQNWDRRERLRDRPGEAESLGPELRYTFVHFPVMPGREQVMASYGTGSFMVFRRPLEPERTAWALALARFLVSSTDGPRADAALARVYTEATGYPVQEGDVITGQEALRGLSEFPSRRSAGRLYGGHPQWEAIWDDIPHAIAPPVHPAWLRVDHVLSTGLQRILLTSDAQIAAMSLTREEFVRRSVHQMAETAQSVLDDFWRRREEHALDIAPLPLERCLPHG